MALSPGLRFSGTFRTMAGVLIIFAKEPVPGQVKTRLAAALGVRAAAELYRQFLLDVVAEMRAIPGLRLVLAYSPAAARERVAKLAPGLELVPQAAGDLGERLEAAFAWGFGRGLSPVMVRNSDSPDLPARLVREAHALLAEGGVDLVLGPCPDGGYYLLGLKKPAPQLFAGIPWSTAAVLRRTRAISRRLHLRERLLCPWPDIDTLADLRAFARQPLTPSDPGWWSLVLARQVLKEVEKKEKSCPEV